VTPDSGLNDEELMALFTRGCDETAFKTLVSRHTTRMYRIACAMLRSTRDAEDAVQECFMRIVRMRNAFKQGTHFAPWAYTILRNFCIDGIRKRQGRYFETLEPETLPSPDHAGLPAEEAEKNEAIRKALNAFPDIEQSAVMLRIYGELDFNNIAESCNISPDAAKKRFYRALEELKKSLSLFK
jgi:RNA polymerase sigma-70 factor, ECF subfamily